MLGYSPSDAPMDVAAYQVGAVADGLASMLEGMGVERAAVVGHDWCAARPVLPGAPAEGAGRGGMALPGKPTRLRALSVRSQGRRRRVAAGAAAPLARLAPGSRQRGAPRRGRSGGRHGAAQALVVRGPPHPAAGGRQGAAGLSGGRRNTVPAEAHTALPRAASHADPQPPLFPLPPPPKKTQRYLFLFADPRAPGWVRADGWALLRELLSAAGGGGADAAVQEAYAARLSPPGALEAALRWYQANLRPGAVAATRVAPALPLLTVSAPVLGVYPARDGALTEGQMVGSARFVAPGLWRYARLAGSGHWPQRDAPGELSAALLAFLEEGGGGGGGEQGQAAAGAGRGGGGREGPRARL